MQMTSSSLKNSSSTANGYPCHKVEEQNTQRPNVAHASVISLECMIHRLKQWLCCDETNKGRHVRTGCNRRSHLPVRDETVLVELVNGTSNREQSLLDKDNQQLLELWERNLAGKERVATKSALSKIKHDFAQKRAAAAKYHMLDHHR